MSFDRFHDGEDIKPAPVRELRPAPGLDRSGADVAKDGPLRLPTAAERIEAYWRARQAADEAYAPWDRAGGTKEGAAAKGETPQRPDRPGPAPEVSERERADDGLPARTADKTSTAEEALRKRVSELEADKVARDRQLAAQDVKLAAQAKTIAEQGGRIDRLEAYVGQITTAVRELRQQDESRPSADIAVRTRGGEAERAEWKEPQHKRRMPTDAVNNVISVAAGGTIADLAYHLRDLSPESAGVAATGVALGAGMIAVWRERRKAKDDADHRPKG